ncbi:tetratricopeptide repeat protein [Phytomonospora sp. NPDC050363]|uniref:tetratricopeptide repeat protein n=1 Tax=Phytomonospora sp. NPDC050363 TaxID=3155642 RepID=UPI003409F607
MTAADENWQHRVDEVFASDDEDTYIERIDALAAELPAGDPAGLFERGGARDATGDERAAIGFYEKALAAGLDGDRRRQCVIQLASSHRNVGEHERAVALLTAERERTSDDLDDAVTAFLALALSSAGRDREALALTLGALGGHMTRYRRSLLHYVAELG